MTEWNSRIAAAGLDAPAGGRALAVPRLVWRSEAVLVALVVAAVAALTLAPYLFAYATAPAGKQFMGLGLNVPDHVQYLSWMRDLASNSLASNRLTAEPNAPAFFNLLWWLAGRFGAISGLEYPIIFQLLRLVGIALGIASFAWFVRLVAPRPVRSLALLLYVAGGGLGIVWVVLKYVQGRDDVQFPFDVYTAEPNTFLSLFGYPHFAIALGLVILTLGLFLEAHRRRSLWLAFLAGAVALVLGLQHAYDLLTIYAVAGAFTALVWLRDRRFPRGLVAAGAIVGLVSAPPALYSFILVSADPVWKAVFAQFDQAGAWTPAPWHLPILLGVPGMLALAAFRPHLLQSRNDGELLVATWFVAHFALAYLPVNFQIHLLLGWQVPIAILAALALYRLGRSDAVRRPGLRRGLVAGALVLCLATNAYLLGWRFLDLGRHQEPYYLSTDQVAALDWLRDHATAGDVVMAELGLGQWVPAWSDARGFLSHWTGTVAFHEKRQLVDEALAAATPAERRTEIFARYGVSYVAANVAAGQLSAIGEPVFVSGDVVLYRTPEVAP